MKSEILTSRDRFDVQIETKLGGVAKRLIWETSVMLCGSRNEKLEVNAMRILGSVVLTFIVLSLMSCGGAKQPTMRPTAVQADLDRADRAMIGGLRMVGEGLNGLTDEQMASVAALVAMTRVATQMEGPGMLEGVMEGFWTELPELCPPLTADTMKRFGDCRDHDTDYAVAMATCLDKGKSESECEKESYGSLERAARCRMKELEALNDLIDLIPGRDWPSPPIPWPDGPHR